MKRAIAIKVHSFVDVITNSSTELFVCNTGKALGAVRSILEDILKVVFDEDYDTDDYSNFFVEPFVYTKEMYEKDSENGIYYAYECKENIGKIMIMGSEDNSIPYRTWDLINNVFNAHNEHLG